MKGRRDVQALEERSGVERCDCLWVVSHARQRGSVEVTYSHICDSSRGLANVDRVSRVRECDAEVDVGMQYWSRACSFGKLSAKGNADWLAHTTAGKPCKYTSSIKPHHARVRNRAFFLVSNVVYEECDMDTAHRFRPVLCVLFTNSCPIPTSAEPQTSGCAKALL